ncbi:hypothetical protein EDI_063050 [Entamoeba dispar SAW760]|uniref:Uncharacterized protein n=1 Tax=Entamoeba dispar (strain ATCC PRA-260 / SAW760) TaxID=370354 RepID=B0EPZ5_ENTDS|nr:uncharacterized protein EDI_063050 [Entamoeba dispar SAW760]EDR23407.1 hypothetical protein EDI_063050 [Entamoeba dispar SAW760]|eukprot:EDR23407.1 hypothetical protein EDI_063050 [Entamoeba dispar SAW760]
MNLISEKVSNSCHDNSGSARVTVTLNHNKADLLNLMNIISTINLTKKKMTCTGICICSVYSGNVIFIHYMEIENKFMVKVVIFQLKDMKIVNILQLVIMLWTITS